MPLFAVDHTMMLPWYDPLKTYCLVEVVSRTPKDILNRPENELFLSRIPPVTGADEQEEEEEEEEEEDEDDIEEDDDEDEDEDEDDLRERHGRGIAGLALTINIDSFANLIEGHSFGRDPERCDLLIGNSYDIDPLHFRVQLDYTLKVPELDIVNCSEGGLDVAGRELSAVGERVRIYQGEIVEIVAGTVVLQLLFPFLDMENPKLLSRWNELRMVAWSLFPSALRKTLIPEDMRRRYLEAEEEWVWQEARPLRFETGSMTVILAKGKIAQKTGFAVVLKRLKDRDGDAREHQFNMGETAAMTQVRHENLVSAFRDTWEPGNVVLVEHTPHSNISDFIRLHNGSRLKEDAVMDVALQTLRGLSHLNSKNLAHRNINPSNIIIFRTDPPLFKLTDFGGEDLRNVRDYLQERIDDDTIDYVAPEVFERGFNATATKSDVWSLAVVMWELLIGASPIRFCGQQVSYVSAFRAILNWQPRARQLQEFGVSDEGQELLLRMLEKNPKFRPDVESLRVDDCFDYLEQVKKNEPCDLQDCIL